MVDYFPTIKLHFDTASKSSESVLCGNLLYLSLVKGIKPI